MSSRDRVPVAVLGGLLVDESPDALIALNENGIILSWNRGAREMFGYAVDEAVGEPLDTLLAPSEHHADARKGLADVLAGQVRVVETARRHKDGSIVHVDLRSPCAH